MGLYFSVEALKVELKFESAVSDQFCKSTEHTDCGQVINSLSGKLLFFKYTDLSFCFFLIQFLLTIIFGFNNINPLYNILYFLLILTIPVTIYSIYIQAKVEKKWCNICLTIIMVIYLEILYLSLVNGFSFKEVEIPIDYIVVMFLISSLVVILFFFIKFFLIKYQGLKEENTLHLRYIRIYDNFKMALFSKVKSNYIFTKESLKFGNRESPHAITVFISPFCSFCKDTFESLFFIYKNYSHSVQINFRFILSDAGDLSEEVYIQLYRIYLEEDDDSFFYALNKWYEINNINKWLNLYEKTTNDRNMIIDGLITDDYEIKKNGINHSPIILINDYHFLNSLSTKYIKYYILDMLEDKRFVH